MLTCGLCCLVVPQEVPASIINFPGVLQPILALITTSAGMSTVEGLAQVVSARPTAKVRNNSTASPEGESS